MSRCAGTWGGLTPPGTSQVQARLLAEDLTPASLIALTEEFLDETKRNPARGGGGGGGGGPGGPGAARSWPRSGYAVSKAVATALARILAARPDADCCVPGGAGRALPGAGVAAGGEVMRRRKQDGMAPAPALIAAVRLAAAALHCCHTHISRQQLRSWPPPPTLGNRPLRQRRRGVRVDQVCPGLVRTGMVDPFRPKRAGGSPGGLSFAGRLSFWAMQVRSSSPR